MLSLDAGVVESTEEGCPPAAAEPGVDEGKVAEVAVEGPAEEGSSGFFPETLW